MPQRIVCSWCDTPLRIDDALRTPFVTCPNCLARLPNPGVPESELPVAEPVYLKARGAGLEADVARDNSGVGCGLILLAFLGGLGVLQSVAVAFSSQDASVIVVLLIALVFLALVSTGIMLVRTQKDPRSRSVGKVLFGMLALAGGLMLGSFALMILFFVVCVAAVLSGGLRF